MDIISGFTHFKVLSEEKGQVRLFEKQVCECCKKVVFDPGVTLAHPQVGKILLGRGLSPVPVGSEEEGLYYNDETDTVCCVSCCG